MFEISVVVSILEPFKPYSASDSAKDILYSVSI